METFRLEYHAKVSDCLWCSISTFVLPYTECQCNHDGTENTCDGFSGKCTCKQNVMGQNCDQCKDGYWDLTKRIEGCVPCQCCSNGSLSASCNKVISDSPHHATVCYLPSSSTPSRPQGSVPVFLMLVAHRMATVVHVLMVHLI